MVNLVKVASCSCVYGFVSGNEILNLEWECADLEWNIVYGERREEQATGFLWRCERWFWLVKFAQLLSKCPSHTKLALWVI